MRTIVVALAVMLGGCAAQSTGVVSDTTQPVIRHSDPVCFLKSPMPEGVKYTSLGSVEGSKEFYGSVNEILPLMAEEARKMGADAVINFWTGPRIGLWAWARPIGTGTAVKLADKSALNCVAAGGELR